MAKIPKNRSDKEMFTDFEEPKSYENVFLAAEQQESKRQAAKQMAAANKNKLEKSFISPELADQLGKALLEVKLELYKEGIVDYRVKVVREGKKIVLESVPLKKKKN